MCVVSLGKVVVECLGRKIRHDRHLGVLEGLLLVGGEDVLHVVGQTEHPPPQTVVGLHLLAQSGELEIPINTHIAKYILSEISISILLIDFVVVL